MADAIKAKIREILSHVPDISNGQDIDTGSTVMETEADVGDGSGVSEGDLVELKNLIKTAPSSDLTRIMEDQEMSPLFKLVTEKFLEKRDHGGAREEGNYADARDHAGAREVTEILGTILNGLPPAYLSKQLAHELVEGLSSPSEAVNEIWLKSLERVVTNQTALGDLLTKTVDTKTVDTETVDIFPPVIRLLSTGSVSIANMCESILVSMCKSGFLDRVMDGRNIQEMNESVGRSDIAKTRVLSLMIHISCVDDKSLQTVSHSGSLSSILHDSFDPTDPLLTLNSLQLLTQLSTTPHGIHFLCGTSPGSDTGSPAGRIASPGSDTGSPACPLDKATNLIVNSEFPLADLLLPGYLTLFASVASNRPSVVSKYGSTMDKILSHFEGRIPPNTPIVATCFDVLGSIGTSGEGKVVLNQCRGMRDFLTTIGSVITGPSGDLKLSALRSLSLLLTMDGSDLNGHEVGLIIETWYSQLSPFPGSVTKALFAMAQEPFLDHRLGSLEVIRVLSLHQFGQKELAGLSPVPSGGQQMATNNLPGGHASFIEYLINRSTEFSKEGKEAKFAIVSELIISPFTISIFGRENYIKLKQYFKEGPFFVSTDSEPQVASRND